ncbi:MAG: bifunctional glycosyltransferase/class I SAM-dependent methyltransferase [Kiritimatiellae bacterium]|nr:bifunctional glycosyltransferase/class I SAM-dependent methyltransferase [Kiritimatiellia bacterium]
MSGASEPTGRRLVSILIPVYNERTWLRPCVERVLAAPLPDGLDREIIIVDDASDDGTAQIARDIERQHAPVVRVIRQPVNQGKGAAIARAIGEMRGQFVIFQDADLEYDPADYPVLLRPLLEGHADVVYGSRFVPRGMRRVLNYHHQLGNRLLTTLSNLCTGLNLTDMETGYKAFRADVLRTIPIRSRRFGIEPELTAKIAKRRCVVYEVPINYHGRSYAEGKKIGWRDGVAAIFTILKFWVVDDCYEDRYGHAILAEMSLARRFHQWMAQVMLPYLGLRILEVGAGIGNLSRWLPRRERLVLSDHDPTYLRLLGDAWAGHPIVRVARFDLDSDADADALAAERFDSVVCANVLEHIADDAAALRRLARVLEPGGRLVLLVPQHPALYGRYDRELGHHRRYRRETLRELVEASGLRVVHMRSFNFAAMLGWWWNSVLWRRRSMSRWQIKAFDLLVPLVSRLERHVQLPGLSLLCVAERPAGPEARCASGGVPVSSPPR